MGQCNTTEDEEMLLKLEVGGKMPILPVVRRDYHDEFYDSFLPKQLNKSEFLNSEESAPCDKIRKRLEESYGVLERSPMVDSKYPGSTRIQGPFLSSDKTMIYKGSVKESYPNGWGEGLNLKTNVYFQGYWENGVPNYFGRCLYSDGSVYEGGLYKATKDGVGRLYKADGEILEGRWKFNSLNGYGTLRAQSGILVYEGEFVNNKKVGMAKYHSTLSHKRLGYQHRGDDNLSNHHNRRRTLASQPSEELTTSNDKSAIKSPKQTENNPLQMIKEAKSCLKKTGSRSKTPNRRNIKFDIADS